MVYQSTTMKTDERDEENIIVTIIIKQLQLQQMSAKMGCDKWQLQLWQTELETTLTLSYHCNFKTAIK